MIYTSEVRRFYIHPKYLNKYNAILCDRPSQHTKKGWYPIYCILIVQEQSTGQLTQKLSENEGIFEVSNLKRPTHKMARTILIKERMRKDDH